jgi:hypothetical protein
VSGLRRVQGAARSLRGLVHHDSNVAGQSYGLTTLIPVLAGHETALEDALAALPLDASPFGRIPQLHFTRLHVIRDLVYQGPPQKPDPLQTPHMIFSASFDGSPERFLDDLARRVGADLDAIFGHCAGYPGTDDPAAFAAWVRGCQVDNGYFLSAYEDATVGDVRAGLGTHAGLKDLAARSRSLDDAGLQAAFHELMAASR